MPVTGEEIRETRRRLNYSQEEFAGKLGITRGLLNAMENGRREVSRATELLYHQFLSLQNVKNVPQETSNPDPNKDQGDYIELLKKYNKVLEEREQLFSKIELLENDNSVQNAKIYALEEFVMKLGSEVRKTTVDSQSVILGKLEGDAHRGISNKRIHLNESEGKKNIVKSKVKAR